MQPSIDADECQKSEPILENLGFATDADEWHMYEIYSIRPSRGSKPPLANCVMDIRKTHRYETAPAALSRVNPHLRTWVSRSDLYEMQ